ncbi:MAG: MFS transporter [Propionibacteriaceae bacterium]|nr:MFS transporter [Propionibacteriaceae bacterium]
MSQGTRGLLAGLLLAVFAMAFQMIGVAAALPRVMASLHAERLYPWAFSALVIGMLAATLTAGQYCDRHGPLRPTLTGFSLLLGGLVIGSVAPDVTTVLVARFVQGLGVGALNLSLFVVIALAFPAERRPSVLAMLSFCWVLPAFLGPLVSAVLVEINWRLTFASTLPLLLAAGLLVLPHLRAVQNRYTPDPGARRIPAWAIVAVAGAPALLQIAGQVQGLWAAAATLGGVLALLLGMTRALPRRVRSLRPGLGPIVASRALQAGAFYAGEAFLLLGLQNLRGLTTFQSGLALTIGSLGWTAGSWLQSRSWVRLRRDQLITLGAALVAAAMAALTAFVIWTAVPLWAGMVAWTVAGFGMGLTMSSTAVATMALSGTQEQGRNSGALQVSESIGNSVLTAVTGATYAALLAANQPTFGWIFLILLVAAGLAVVSSLRIGPVHDSVH